MTLHARLAEALREGGVLPLPGWSAHRLAGRDALELVSRLSTNDLSPLAAGRAVTTVFLSPLGRVLFRAILAPSPAAEDAAIVAVEGVGGDGAADLASWLDRYTFTEDVRLVPLAGGRVELALGAAPPQDRAVVATMAGELPRLLGDRARVVVATAPEAGPEPLRGTLPHEAWTLLRVLCAEPAAGSELTPEHHPLEARLEPAISFTKGCYTGQEVVARQDSRGRVSRRLVVLAAESPLEVGEAFVEEMKDGCRVTTVAPEVHPRLGHLALAYVGTKWAAAGATVTTAAGVPARVVEPPGP